MKSVVALVLTLLATGAPAQMPVRQFPSCDLGVQRHLRGSVGGSIRDPRQAHLSMRANILQADLGNAEKAGRLTQATATRLFKRVEAIRNDADRTTRRRGFLSAGAGASYDRALDAVAVRLCRR